MPKAGQRSRRSSPTCRPPMRRRRRSRRCRKLLTEYPTDPEKWKAASTQGQGPRRARRAAAAARRAVRRQGREGARHGAAQLHRHRVLHDVRHRGAAAHPDALLHDAERAAGARVGVLVALLHLPALLHGALSRGAREVRRVHESRGQQLRVATGMGGGMGGGGSNAAQHHRHQQGRHRAARRDRDRRRPDRAGDAGDRGPAVRRIGPGGGRAVWRRRSRPRTVCCSRSPTRCRTISTTR